MFYKKRIEKLEKRMNQNECEHESLKCIQDGIYVERFICNYCGKEIDIRESEYLERKIQEKQDELSILKNQLKSAIEKEIGGPLISMPAL